MKMILLGVGESPRKEKKKMAIIDDGGKIHKIHFGQRGAEDFTMHKDERRKAAYLSRHAKEDWTNPLKPAWWSRWLLWEHDDYDKALEEVRKKLEGL